MFPVDHGWFLPYIPAPKSCSVLKSSVYHVSVLPNYCKVVFAFKHIVTTQLTSLWQCQLFFRLPLVGPTQSPSILANALTKMLKRKIQQGFYSVCSVDSDHVCCTKTSKSLEFDKVQLCLSNALFQILLIRNSGSQHGDVCSFSSHYKYFTLLMIWWISESHVIWSFKIIPRYFVPLLYCSCCLK